jgi:hypothetical protein
MPEVVTISGHGAILAVLNESPPLDPGTVREQCPGLSPLAEQYTMKILAAQKVETPRADMTDADRGGIVAGRAQLVVASGQHQAHGAIPGMIMQPAVGIRIHEPVQVEVPAEASEEVVTLKVGFAFLSIDKTAGQTSSHSVQQALNHGYANSRVSDWIQGRIRR